MTLTTHGIREGSKVDRPDDAKLKKREKEKEKAEEDEGSSDQGKKKAEEKEEGKAALTWWVKKDMRKNGMKEMSGMILMKAIGPMIKTGMKAIGPMMIDLYYLDEYGYFQKKGKGKGKGKKGKKGKVDDGKGGKPGDGKGKSNYVQPQTSPAPAIQNLVFIFCYQHGDPNHFWSLVSTTFDIIGSPTSFSWSTTRGSTLGLIA